MHSVVRIAHGYGNNRGALKRALAAPVDMVEADVWFRAGVLWVRHERRLDPLPLLADSRAQLGSTYRGFAVAIGPYYIRPDVNPLRLREVLAEAAAAGKGVLIDVKARKGDDPAAYARALAAEIGRAAAGTAVVCGQDWPVLDALRRAAPEAPVRYSFEREQQYRRLQQRVEGGDAVAGVCAYHRLLNADRLAWFARHNIGVYCWTVDREGAALALVRQGVEGVISNNLALLARLP